MRCNWEKAILGRERIPEARTCLVCFRNRKEVSEYQGVGGASEVNGEGIGGI